MSTACPSCGQENADDARVCTGCGATLGVPCRQCGAIMSPTAKFCSECGAAAQPVVEEGERRHLTVLFADLAGSTSIAERLDPEDWRDTVVRFQQEAVRVIEQAGGYVAQYLGDGLLVYFGYPRASENDAERAVRCGLELVEATRALNPELQSAHDVQLSLRVGVHSGPVVVSEVGGTRRETLALGKTANLAARVQSAAKPNTAYVTQATLRRIAPIFVTHDVGEFELKGIERPVRLHEVLHPSESRGRFAAPGHALTPFVGRQRELDELEDRFARAHAGQGQLLTIRGEAGIGKSRLAHAFERSLPVDAHAWHECQGAAYNRDSPLQPWLHLQRDLLGIGAASTDEAKVAALETALGEAGLDLDEAVPLFAAAHGLALPDRYTLPDVSPLGLRKRTLALMADWLIRLGRDQTVVLLVEDLHWLDPSSVELIGQLTDRIGEARLLVLLTQRPEFEPPWQEGPSVSSIALERLSTNELHELIAHASDESPLGDDWVEAIHNRSDGVPLFAEELARAAAQSTDASGGAASAQSVPETLEDLLMSRLERMDDVKTVAQLASVLGREFPIGLLEPLWRGERATLRSGLEAAERARILTRVEGAHEDRYAFHHALIRDAAYGSMLRRTRRRHHQAVATALREHFPDRVAEQPELLAHHLTEAQAIDAAIEAWREAGALALGGAAYEEAIRHLRRARTLLHDHPDDVRNLDVVQMLAGVLLAERGWAHEETHEAWEAAAALCDADKEPLRAGAIACGLGDAYSSQDLGKSLDHFVALADRGRTRELPLLTIAGHQGAAIPLRYLGRYAEARGHLDRGLATYDVDRHRFVDAGFHEEKGISLLLWSAWVHWDVGDLDRAREDARRAGELADALDSPFARAFADSWGSGVEVFSGNWPQALELGARAAKLAADHGFLLLEAMGRFAELASRGVLEDLNEAPDLYRIEIGRLAATGNQLGGAEVFAILARLELEMGLNDQALATVDVGLGLGAGLQQPWCNAWLQTLKAQAMLRRGEAGGEADEAEAEALLREALDTANRQGARSYALRAASALASMLHERGRGAEAAPLLTAAIAPIVPSESNLELARAREILSDL